MAEEAHGPGYTQNFVYPLLLCFLETAADKFFGNALTLKIFSDRQTSDLGEPFGINLQGAAGNHLIVLQCNKKLPGLWQRTLHNLPRIELDEPLDCRQVF